MERAADGANATTRGGGETHYERPKDLQHQYACVQHLFLLVGGRRGIVSGVFKLGDLTHIDPDLDCLIAEVELNVAVCNMQSLRVACCHMDLKEHAPARDFVHSWMM